MIHILIFQFYNPPIVMRPNSIAPRRKRRCWITPYYTPNTTRPSTSLFFSHYTIHFTLLTSLNQITKSESSRRIHNTLLAFLLHSHIFSSHASIVYLLQLHTGNFNFQLSNFLFLFKSIRDDRASLAFLSILVQIWIWWFFRRCICF